MARPYRSPVIDEVVRTLKTISAGAGYLTSPAKVVTAWTPIDAHAEFPVLIVTPAIVSPAPVIRSIQDAFRDQFAITVWGYVKGADGTCIEEREALYQDVLTALIANATLTNAAGTALASDLMPIGPRETDGGLLEDHGVFVQDVLITIDPVVFPGP